MSSSPTNLNKRQSSLNPSQCRPNFAPKNTTLSLQSLLTRYTIKTQTEIQQTINKQRARSYQKLSLNLRKMDKLFSPARSPEREKKCIQKEQQKGQSGSKVQYRVKSKERKEKKESELRLKTCEGFNFEDFPKKKTLLTMGQLIEYVPLRESESPSKSSPLKARMKTQYIQKKGVPQGNERELQQQLLYPKGIDFKNSLIPSPGKAAIDRKNIPGVTFKGKSEEKKGKKRGHNHSGSAVTQMTTYLHSDELLSEDRSSSIEKLYRLRSDKELKELPKQWHFYNCLNLTHLSLYRTNLKLSCESWVLIDHLELKYLRGWNPKDRLQISVVGQLLLTKMVLQLSLKLNLKETTVRINNVVVRNKMQEAFTVLTDRQFSLKNSTISTSTDSILSLWDLCIGMLLTTKVDLMWHLLYALAYLHQHTPYTQSPTPIHIEHHPSTLQLYEQIFFAQAQSIASELRLVDTEVRIKKKQVVMVKNEKLLWGQAYDHSVFKQTNQFQYLHCVSSSLQVSIIFMDLLSHPHFYQFFQSNTHQCTIKHQVGYNFWQSRHHTFKHPCPQYHLHNFLALSLKNTQQQTYGIVGYHRQDKTITVCNDCKVNMCLRDILGVRKWMGETFKRFRKSENKKEKEAQIYQEQVK